MIYFDIFYLGATLLDELLRRELCLRELLGLLSGLALLVGDNLKVAKVKTFRSVCGAKNVEPQPVFWHLLTCLWLQFWFQLCFSLNV